MPLPWPWQQEGQQACRKSSLCLFTPNRTTPQTKSPAPANCLKSFTWIICTKPNCSPGFWQKVLAYFTAKPLAPHRKWSDANRNTPFTPGGQKGPQPIVQGCFFPLCWSPDAVLLTLQLLWQQSQLPPLLPLLYECCQHWFFIYLFFYCVVPSARL